MFCFSTGLSAPNNLHFSTWLILRLVRLPQRPYPSSKIDGSVIPPRSARVHDHRWMTLSLTLSCLHGHPYMGGLNSQRHAGDWCKGIDTQSVKHLTILLPCSGISTYGCETRTIFCLRVWRAVSSSPPPPTWVVHHSGLDVRPWHLSPFTGPRLRL